MKIKDEYDNIRITFIGLGSSTFKFGLTEELLNKMNQNAKLFYLPLEVAIFDASFFEYLNHVELSCLYDLKKWEINGLLESNLMQIEIWHNTRKKRVIKNIRYENSLGLFPKYNVNQVEIKYSKKEAKIITISESYIGLIKTFRFTTDRFDMDKLVFNMSSFELTSGNIQNIYTSICYDGITIKNIASDNLITNRIALIE